MGAVTTGIVQRSLTNGLFRAKPCAVVRDGCTCLSPSGLCHLATLVLVDFFPKEGVAILARPNGDSAGKRLSWEAQTVLAELTRSVVEVRTKFLMNSAEVKGEQESAETNVHGLSLQNIDDLADAQLCYLPKCSAKGGAACRCATATIDAPCPLVLARLTESFGRLNTATTPAAGRPALESALGANFLQPIICGEGSIPGCSCPSGGTCSLWLEAAIEVLESAALPAPPLVLSPEPPHAVDAVTAAWTAVDSPTRWAQWDERAEKTAATRSARLVSALKIGALTDSASCAAGTALALFTHHLGYARRCAAQLADSGCLCDTDPVDCPVLGARLRANLRYDNMISNNFVDEVLALIRLQIVAPVRCHTRTRRSNCACAAPPSADSPCPKWLARLETSLGSARVALLTPSKPRRRRVKAAAGDVAAVVTEGAAAVTHVTDSASPSSSDSWADSVDADPETVSAQMTALGAAFAAAAVSSEPSPPTEPDHMTIPALCTPSRPATAPLAPCTSPADALLCRAMPGSAVACNTLMDKSTPPPSFAAIERCGRRDA